MEENKVATDKELLAIAGRLVRKTLELDYAHMSTREIVEAKTEAIFRELVAVRDATIKKVLVYEADVAAYESYCVGRGEKP